jgi:hypothetical protein
MTNNLGGRPLKYSSVEDLQSIIDEYFQHCDNRIKEVHKPDGETYGYSNPEPYTMSGLAYALGLSRQGLMEYKAKDGFSDAIKDARNRVEVDIERRMNDKDTFTPGLIFNAKNNFGWRDKTEQEVTSPDGSMTPVVRVIDERKQK